MNWINFMKCTSPTWLKEMKMYVPCGWCKNCLMQRKSEWAMRMQHELLYWKNASFITLTYDDQNLPMSEKNIYWPTLRKTDLQKSIKRIRKEIYPKKIKYYMCGEYGPKTQRPHYHGIIYGLDYIKDVEVIIRNWDMCDWNEERIEKSIQSVNYDACSYVAEYVLKKINDRDDEEYGPTGREKPFRIQSNGLGKQFAIEEKNRIINNKLTSRGVAKTVPRYYLKVHGMKACDIIPENERLNREADKNFKILGVHNTNVELYGSSNVAYWRSLHYYIKRQKDKQRDRNLQSRLKIYSEHKIL